MYELTEADWAAVEKMAKDLVHNGVDLSVARQASDYLNKYNKIGDLLDWLDELTKNPEALRRSNQTPDYYIDVREICYDYLDQLDNNEQAKSIFAWAVRVAAYYKKQTPGAKPPPSNVPNAKPAPGNNFAAGSRPVPGSKPVPTNKNNPNRRYN